MTRKFGKHLHATYLAPEVTVSFVGNTYLQDT